MPNNVIFRSQNRNAIPAAHAKFPGSGENIVGAGGEINAGSTQELMQRLVEMANLVQAGTITLKNEESTDSRKLREKRREVLTAAYQSERNSREWQELGAAIAADLLESADREGLMRRTFHRVPLSQGEEPRIRVRYKDVVAIVSSSAVDSRAVYLRQRYLRPDEWYIDANIRVEERELAQGSGDILEEKFYESQEAIMVAEDRRMKRLFDDSVGIANNLQILAGGLSPSALQQMRDQVIRWNLPTQTLMIASDVLDDIVGQGSGTFNNYFDPVSQYEIIQTGKIGTLLGMEVVTDAYREPFLKVLDRGDIYVTSSPQMLGAFTDRGPVQSREVDAFRDGSPARGWYFFELIAMVLHNARAVCKGTRA